MASFRWLKIYTDGSLFEGWAGFGVFLEELDLKASFALGTFAAVFQAEVYAIVACFDYCSRECINGKTICICSDSRAALLALSLHTVSSRLVLQCRNSPVNLSIQVFGKPILSVSEYEGISAGSFVQFAEKSGRFKTRVQ
jgi:hypothetical protein